MTEYFYKNKYPHLLDENRINLALDYLVHEFGKIFPKNISHTQIRENLEMLAPVKKDSKDVTIRDFWNLFGAISGGWRLKALIKIITDQNIEWQCSDISIEKLQPGNHLGWVKEMLAIKTNNPFSLEKALNFLRTKDNFEEIKRKSEDIAKRRHEEDKDDPLIGLFQKTGTREYINIHDGNRRFITKIEQMADQKGQNGSNETMKVWVGVIKGSQKNFWVPTTIFFDMKDLFSLEKYLDNKLKEISPVAKHEFDVRVKK